MSNFSLKENLLWRDWLLRAALVIGTVAIVVWSMPHDNNNSYLVEQGKPWKYADLTAPFDFPVYKSDEAIKHERDSILKQYEPYYNIDASIEARMVRKFVSDYPEGIAELPQDYIEIISNRLHSLYQQGIMESKEYEELKKDTFSMIRIVNNKQSSSVSILEIYSAKSAY